MSEAEADSPDRWEGPRNAKWVARRKHFFVVSNAGRPVFSQFGDEQRLADFMGAVVGILSFINRCVTWSTCHTLCFYLSVCHSDCGPLRACTTAYRRVCRCFSVAFLLLRAIVCAFVCCSAWLLHNSSFCLCCSCRNDELRWVEAGEHKWVFRTRGQLRGPQSLL